MGNRSAARAICSGDAEIVVAGGMENMSAAPYAIPGARWGQRMFDGSMVDTMVRDGLWDAFNQIHMGMTAENVCDRYGITREELDAFALASQQKTAAAQAADRFNDEIVPVEVKQKKQTVTFCHGPSHFLGPGRCGSESHGARPDPGFPASFAESWPDGEGPGPRGGQRGICCPVHRSGTRAGL